MRVLVSKQLTSRSFVGPFKNHDKVVHGLFSKVGIKPVFGAFWPKNDADEAKVTAFAKELTDLGFKMRKVSTHLFEMAKGLTVVSFSISPKTGLTSIVGIGGSANHKTSSD